MGIEPKLSLCIDEVYDVRAVRESAKKLHPAHLSESECESSENDGDVFGRVQLPTQAQIQLNNLASRAHINQLKTCKKLTNKRSVFI